MAYISNTLQYLLEKTAFVNLYWGNFVMIFIACVILYFAIVKKSQPLLLIPISFGMIFVNMFPGIIAEYHFNFLNGWTLLPCLIFLGIGAKTDFAPLIAGPSSFFLGAAAQLGIYMAYLLALLWGFGDKAAAVISMIGGADGPTSIFLAGKMGMGGTLLGPIVIVLYVYIAFMPIIQPVIMKGFTNQKEREIKMKPLRAVSKLERILFPILVTIVAALVIPAILPLIGMLMLGNLFRESGVVKQLTETASNTFMNIAIILLGISVGAATTAQTFLKIDILIMIGIGLVALILNTVLGVLFGKIMCLCTNGKINPLIGSAGVGGIPIAAQVSDKVGVEADPKNSLLIHAKGVNAAGLISTVMIAGIFMTLFGV